LWRRVHEQRVLYMPDDRRISEDWEVVARHGNYAWWQAILAFVLGLFDPVGATSVVAPNSVTLTTRRKSTGATYYVTADNEHAALAKLRSDALPNRPPP
jgi:hypothetical protein